MICILFIISILLIPLYYKLFITGKLPKPSDVIREAENILRTPHKGKDQ